MKVTIEIPEKQAVALKAQADAAGLTMELWLAKLAGDWASEDSMADLQATNPEEWARRFHEWAIGHDRSTPLLSEDAIRRESIYPDRA